MFAHLDDYISHKCLINNIPHSYSSWKPLTEFVDCLMRIYIENKKSVVEKFEKYDKMV